MTIRLADVTDPDAFAEFIVTNAPWPFHVRPTPTAEQIAQAWADGAYNGQASRTFWALDDGSRAGIVTVSDLTDDTPMLDLRLAPLARGRGLGVAALREVTAWVFTELPDIFRFEGTTRADNVAMHKTFERCGFVREAYYRQSWPSSEQLHDAAGYAILRTDWETGTTTPVPALG